MITMKPGDSLDVTFPLGDRKLVEGARVGWEIYPGGVGSMSGGTEDGVTQRLTAGPFGGRVAILIGLAPVTSPTGNQSIRACEIVEVAASKAETMPRLTTAAVQDAPAAPAKDAAK